MKLNLNFKIATVFAGLGLSLISTFPALGATFSFSQKTITGEPFVSGTFSGVDSNNDSFIQIDELTSFDALLEFNSVAFSLDNLFEFTYAKETNNSLYFYVQKRVDVNNDFASSELYDLAVNGFESFSFLSVTFFKDDEPFAIADGGSDRPVQVSQVRSVPEPSAIKSLIFLVLFSLAVEKISARRHNKVTYPFF